MVPSSEFTCAHLEEYPVWSEWYDSDEREEIIGWGIDAAWLDQQFSATHNGSSHAMYPLLDVNPFPERMRISIRARFRTPAGQPLSGYLINEDADPAIFICHEGNEFGINRHFRGAFGQDESQDESVEELRQMLTDPNDPLFPLAYETDFSDWDGNPIAGIFALDDEP